MANEKPTNATINQFLKNSRNILGQVLGLEQSWQLGGKLAKYKPTLTRGRWSEDCTLLSIAVFGVAVESSVTVTSRAIFTKMQFTSNQKKTD